jgi:hypothetical protein
MTVATNALAQLAEAQPGIQNASATIEYTLRDLGERHRTRFELQLGLVRR